MPAESLVGDYEDGEISERPLPSSRPIPNSIVGYDDSDDDASGHKRKHKKKDKDKDEREHKRHKDHKHKKKHKKERDSDSDEEEKRDKHGMVLLKPRSDGKANGEKAERKEK